MDLVRLGERYTTSYLPDDVIEGYSSAIWTERFIEPGEFVIKTSRIEEFLKLLPLDTLISHMDTRDVMMVESHSIETTDDGIKELTITGRSATCMFDHRYIETIYSKKRKMRYNYNATSGFGVLVWHAINNGSTADVTRGDRDGDTPEQNNYTNASTPKDVIPNCVVTDSIPVDGALVTKGWWLAEGSLGPQIRAFQEIHDVGIRMIRPTRLDGGQVLTVKTALAERGQTTRTNYAVLNQLRFDLYKGTNRTEGQLANDKVVFSVLQGDMDNASYLWSYKDYKTVIEVMSSIGVSDVYRNSTEAGYSGWKRRVGEYSGGQPEVPAAPAKPADLPSNATKAQRKARAAAIDKWLPKIAKWRNKRDKIYAEFREDMKDYGLRQLKGANKSVVLLTTNISPYSPYQYKVNYDLGDRVTIVGDHGLKADMIVVEYTRTEDENGDQGYPGLSVP